MHQEVLGWKSIKMGEMSKDKKLETITTLPISQEEVIKKRNQDMMMSLIVKTPRFDNWDHGTAVAAIDPQLTYLRDISAQLSLPPILSITLPHEFICLFWHAFGMITLISGGVCDTGVHPGPRIFPLKFRGEGDLGQGKKRKMDSKKSSQHDMGSCRPSSVNPLDNISGQIREVRELVSRLPQGPGEPSTTRHSYMTPSDYDIYCEEQKKQGATIFGLKRAYAALVGSHRDLKKSYMNIVKREKK
ncbi:hypothetical protein FXO38_36569 [Capsicum annuum]|nr:hypothetical protein FXO38_36569 [Capsicum annuum]